MKSTTYANLGPLFAVATHDRKDKNPLANHLQGSGIQEIDSLCSKVIYRIANPKAKSKVVKGLDGKITRELPNITMNRNQSLQAVEHKKVSTDELQDCWQTLQCMCFQGIHLQEDGVFKMFAACRDILRINNTAGDYCDSLDFLLGAGFQIAMPHKEQKHGVERVMRAQAVREQRRLINASFAMDNKRQRASKKKTAMAFLRSILDGSIGRLTKSARSERGKAFRLYTSIGSKFLAQSVDSEALKQDMSNLPDAPKEHLTIEAKAFMMLYLAERIKQEIKVEAPKQDEKVQTIELQTNTRRKMQVVRVKKSVTRSKLWLTGEEITSDEVIATWCMIS